MLQCLAATAPRRNVRDDREAPLLMRRDARQMKLIWVEEEARYFSREDWTGRIGLIRLAKSVFVRGRNLPVTSVGRGLTGTGLAGNCAATHSVFEVAQQRPQSLA
jgi:hypothetical protein